MNDPRFELLHHTEQVYEQSVRQLAFNARTITHFGAWKRALRAQMTTLLGLQGRTVPQNPPAERLQAIDRGDYIEEKYSLDVGEGVEAPMYVLVPKTPPPYKPIIVFHGHSSRRSPIQSILGNYDDEETARQMNNGDNNHAQALAQAGYLVCAVEQRGFGERVSQFFETPNVNTCRHLSFAYMLEGRTLLGERLWDGMNAISTLLGREDVVPGVLGCTGHSGGGTAALWLTALDERITVSIPQSYFCSFKASILDLRHCECNYVPGIVQYAEMGDIGAMIAPRPFRVVSGEADPIFPVEAVREQFQTVEKAYALHGIPAQCSLEIHPGDHVYHFSHSKTWFDAWL